MLLGQDTKELDEKLKFYNWVPDFCKRIALNPTTKNYVSKFVKFGESSGNAEGDEEEEEGETEEGGSWGDGAITFINDVLKNNVNDLVSSEMLAAICFQHYHGAVEDTAFEALLHHMKDSDHKEQVSGIFFIKKCDHNFS